MSKALQVTSIDTAKLIEDAVMAGDLSKLTSADRVGYYKAVCQSIGLNPLTKPFEYIVLNGKLTLYARRDATDQLRKIHNVSIEVTKSELVGDVYVVTAKATMPGGRTDSSTGAVTIKGLSPDNLSNAYMKCETKAKRRVTLSICGLGLLDETEVESISRHASPLKAQQVTAIISSNDDIELEPEEPDFVTETAASGPIDVADYVIPIGKQHKGKKLSQLSKSTLQSFVDWVELNIKNKNEQTIEFLEAAKTYLEGL